MIRFSLRARLVAAGLLFAAALPLPAPTTAAILAPPPPVPGRYFADTGHMLDQQFIAYYDKANGARLLGAPLTESYQDGGRLVQLLERGRLERDAKTGLITPSPLGQWLTAGRAPDPAAPAPGTDPQGLYDATTGHAVGPLFAATWQAAGGAARLGRPISEAALDAASGLYTQYFEFARLTGNATSPITVRLQDNVRRPGSPFAPVAKPATAKGVLFIPNPGHVLHGGFLDSYKNAGGADLLGAPLTEEVVEGSLTVQYFERAKLVYDQTAPAGKQISWAALGREWLAGHPAPAAALSPAVHYQVIGSATTGYTGSINGRIHNLLLATQRLNGVVVPAGETFSFNKSLGNDGESAGFVKAKVILNGKLVDGVGGGICQVATTAFRAAFYSGMDIVERHPHSFRISYYEPPLGLDATVFSDEGVDMRWRNNLDVPVLIQTATDTRAATITFTFLATKPAKYKVTRGETQISNIVKHGSAVHVDDPTVAAGKVTQTDHAKDGMTTRLTRTLMDPATGKTVRVETYTSLYVPWVDRFVHGTKGAKPKTAPKPPATATATPATPQATPATAPIQAPKQP